MYGMSDATSARDAYRETRKQIKKEIRIIDALTKDMKDTEETIAYIKLQAKREGLKLAVKCIGRAVDEVGEG